MVKKVKKKKGKVVKPEFNQVIYDENGYRIGDDGYPMTRVRRALHRTLNAMLIWGYACCVIAVVCVLAAFFQNQSFTPTEFVYYGGNEYNGYPIATLLRFEALATFIGGLLSIMMSHRCFNWMYDGGEDSILMKFYIPVIIIAGGWNMYLIAFPHLIDPASLLLAIFAFSMLWFMVKVKAERRTLRPSVPVTVK